MIYDFHTHSILSDGSLLPEEVVSFAKKRKVDYLALTDHDTMHSMDIAKELNEKESSITIFGGLEVSSRISSIDKNAHILAYRCNRDDKALNDLVEKTIGRRTESFYKSIDIINAKGDIKIDKDKIESYKGKNGFHKHHLIKYLVDEGYAEKIHCEATRKILGRTKGYAFVDFDYPECSEAIQIIKDSGGIPILAHTFVSNNFSAINELLEAGLMGIEVYHPMHNAEQCRILNDFCDSKNLLVTCGSDFHRFHDSDHCDIGDTSIDNDKIRTFLSFLKK